MLSETNLARLPSESNNEDDEESFHSADEDDDNDLLSSRIQQIPASDVITGSYYKFQINLKRMQIFLIDKPSVFEQFKNSLNKTVTNTNTKEYYILTPLDLFFNIHQCIYADDVNLPAWKVFGRVPLISTELTNKKLEQVIKLAASIPLPNSSNHSSTLIEYETIYEESNEIDLIDQLNALNKKEESTVAAVSHPGLQTTKSQYFKLEKLQQAINLELSFEINEILFKLTEEAAEKTYFDWILFKILSCGTFVQMKTYDTSVNIYLNYVECEYGLLNDIDGTKLYLVSSMDRDASKHTLRSLVDIEIIQTDAQSPTLGLLHHNILTNVEMKMCSLNFVLNLVAIKNLLKFVDMFQNSFEMPKYEINQSEPLKTAVKKPAALPYLNEDQIKLLVTKAARQLKPREHSNVIELKLNAVMDGVKARVCTAHSNYFQLNVNNFQLNLLNKQAENNVDIILNSISVQDLQPGANYENIVSLKENTDNLISVNLAFVNPPVEASQNESKLARQFQKEKVYFKNYLNKDHFDLLLKANISKLRFLFVYKHLDTLLVKFY